MNKHYIKGTLVALFLSVSFGLYSQTGNVAINQNATPANSSAVLDLSQNANLGFLMTNVNLASTTDATTISGPIAGMIVWNTNASLPLGVGFYYWTGTALTPNNTWLYVNNSGTGSTLTGSGIAGYSARWTSATNLSSGVLQDNGTGVSISSTALTPVNKLDVNGSAAFGTYAGTAAPTNGMIVSGKVGIGTNAPNTSAALDITSTSQGLLPPRIANPSTIAAPAAGLVVFNSTTNCIEYYTGTAWLSMACPCNTPPATPGTISGATSLCAASTGNTYSIPAVANTTTYTWTVPGGSTITSGQGTTSIVVTAGTTSGLITVTATNSCGTSAAAILTLSISNGIPSAPSAPSGTTSPAISTANTYTTATVPGATSYSWSVSSTNGTVTAGQGTTSVTITFSGTAATMNICVASSNICGTSSPSCLSVTSTSCPHATIPFTYTGSIVAYTLPACVTQITITAAGAQGGASGYSSGGLGAIMQGTFTVAGGTSLIILVGGQGGTGTNHGGGGGGSFVTTSTYSPLCIAGGGGGAYYSSDNYDASTVMPASTTTSGNPGIYGSGSAIGGAGGTTGGGGGCAPQYTFDEGQGGAGLTGNGCNNQNADVNTPTIPQSLTNGGAGGVSCYTTYAGNGGFGGGGAGDWCNWTGGGGGGGYSGGGGGTYYGCGGGGGSYNGGTSQTNTVTNSGNGYITIQY